MQVIQRRVLVLRHWLSGILLGGVLASFACGEFETGYFQHRVNDATQDVVARRYGPPHRHQNLPNGQSIWTYYDRGSGTSGYTGYARSQYCRAYVMTFDDQGILRDWRQDDCSATHNPLNDPTLDRK